MVVILDKSAFSRRLNETRNDYRVNAKSLCVDEQVLISIYRRLPPAEQRRLQVIAESFLKLLPVPPPGTDDTNPLPAP